MQMACTPSSERRPGGGRSRASLAHIESVMTSNYRRAHGHFGGMTLDSAFQPIFSLAHRRIVGHEGLLRATSTTGFPVAPLAALETAVGDDEVVFLDRLCRAIHLHNYTDGIGDPTWLFLNVSARVITRGRDYGSFFSELLQRHHFPPQRVVVEILEDAIPEVGQLNDAVAFYRDIGCLVAIDDFGANAADIERIWRVSPDIVKLDRKMITAAEHSDKARRILPATVALIHEAGSLALIEGIENEQQALIALDSNADLVQGFHLARPAPIPLRHGDGGLVALAERHPVSTQAELQRTLLAAHIDEFLRTAQQLGASEQLLAASAPLLAMDRVDRCYLISAQGIQVGASAVARRRSPSRFLPLDDAAGANWSRKPYHYVALTQPNKVHVSRPYLSVANSRICRTLSMALPISGCMHVFCCDVIADTPEATQ